MNAPILWVCICHDDVMLQREGIEAFSLPFGDKPPVDLKPWQIVTTLNLQTRDDRRTDEGQQQQVKVVRLDAPIINHPHYVMMNLRASFDVLHPTHYAIAGKAAELIYWDQNTKYCGCCGAPMQLHTEISKRCTICGKEVWPQLAIAVIVRITRTVSQPNHSEEEVLLVHAKNFRRSYYGLVAGFVETGETLEEAVRREVQEETGVEIDDIQYFGSQPWPYPCGLMVGFTAKYVSGELHLQRSELSAGGWFTRHHLPDIPGPSSIARRLIDDWLKG